jgi:hypothetical protein
MIKLSETTDKLQVVLAGTVTANQLQCVASWSDINSSTLAVTDFGRTIINTNNTTDVDIVGSPGATTRRLIDFVSIYNNDTANATVTLKLDANGTEAILQKVTLGAGETLIYSDKNGFYTLDSSGRIKNAYFENSGVAVINTLNIVVLSGDVVNNNAVANTIADVTGLSFAVTADQTYWFEFVIPYTSAATTTGSRWAINGPAAPTLLNMRSEYTLAATTTTVNSVTAYDTPSGANATSLTAGNVATLWGVIKPSQNGTVVARFASEVSGSAITAKAGATLRWMRII